MTGDQRRAKILSYLEGAQGQISASALAREFSVSRQVIVGDVAILRAQGHNIVALARGYVLEKSSLFERVFKVYHSDEDTEKELNIFVDAGGVCVDVFIYHRSYGEVHAPMNLKSRFDVANFLTDIASGKSSLLKNVTSGYHYHTIQAESAEILDIIEANLKENGFLAPLQDYEPKKLRK
ncbi:MAG: transcription repressor NadR [Clostridia bacterium]|nr:transcription repressor NadR [Clostridia bacterium]MBR2296921.1 transcription repressor NadR [Clostridia bacterium]